MLALGTVLEFDEHRGSGAVRADDGRELYFHCTEIAGGTRTVAEGTAVVFTVVACHHGRWEAADVTPVRDI
ncbi:MAG: cold shock domain-containing protein [Acidimicrobiales bacterium]